MTVAAAAAARKVPAMGKGLDAAAEGVNGAAVGCQQRALLALPDAMLSEVLGEMCIAAAVCLWFAAATAVDMFPTSDQEGVDMQRPSARGCVL